MLTCMLGHPKTYEEVHHNYGLKVSVHRSRMGETLASGWKTGRK